MKVKVNELTGIRLDWAVAHAKGEKVEVRYESSAGRLLFWLDHYDEYGLMYYSPSEYWSQGGPLIEERNIDVRCLENGMWQSRSNRDCLTHGPTPLIAVCRNHVASVLGREVDIPDELAWN